MTPMRLALTLTLLASPAAAWEFASSPVCTLSHDTGDVAVTVTKDPSLPEPYAIALTLADGTWPEVPVFAIQFVGPFGLVIQTDRHALSEDGRTLTVTDTGFDNVLDGIGLNRTAIMLVGPAVMPVDLDGAGGPVAAFRDCPQDATS